VQHRHSGLGSFSARTLRRTADGKNNRNKHSKHNIQNINTHTVTLSLTKRTKKTTTIASCRRSYIAYNENPSIHARHCCCCYLKKKTSSMNWTTMMKRTMMKSWMRKTMMTTTSEISTMSWAASTALLASAKEWLSLWWESVSVR